MSRKSVFVKVSGDLFLSESFLNGLMKLTRDFFVVICVGGGTQINKALKEAGYETKKHGPLGREAESFEEKQIARDVLEKNQMLLQDILADRKIPATVVIPVIDIGSVLCHVNGDTFVRTVYLGFDQIYIATTHNRVNQKKKDFADLPKIRVLGFDS